MIGNVSRHADEDSRDVASLTHREPGGASQRGIAEQIVDDVRDAAASLFDDQRARAADTVHSIAEALHQTAESLNRDNVSLGQYADRAADHIDAFSARIRGQRWSDWVAEADAVAHRQPALFLTGAVTMGFLVGRFLAASAAERNDRIPSSYRPATGVGSGRRGMR